MNFWKHQMKKYWATAAAEMMTRTGTPSTPLPSREMI